MCVIENYLVGWKRKNPKILFKHKSSICSFVYKFFFFQSFDGKFYLRQFKEISVLSIAAFVRCATSWSLKMEMGSSSLSIGGSYSRFFENYGMIRFSFINRLFRSKRISSTTPSSNGRFCSPASTRPINLPARVCLRMTSSSL